MSKMFAKIMGIGVVTFALALAFSVVMPAGAIAGDMIKIGQLAPISGPFSHTGHVHANAVKFAVEEQNKKGGLLGKKIELLLADSELRPDVATRRTKEFILRDKVDLLAGDVTSSCTLAMMKVAHQYKTILINYVSNTDSLQGGKDFSPYVFRVAYNSYSISSAQAQAVARMPYRKFFIINQDNVTGHSFAEGFRDRLKEFVPDAKIVGEVFHPAATKDFGPYITKIIVSGADAVFTTNFGPDYILLIQQARSMGLETPFPFVAIHMEPTTWMTLQEASVGVHLTFPADMRVNTPANNAFVAKFHERFKNEKEYYFWWPFGSVSQTAFAWMMTFAAIEKAGSLDPEKFIKTFEGFEWESPVGMWKMRKCDHNLIQPMYAGFIVTGGNPWFNGSIDPKVKCPWIGPDIVKLLAESIARPATSDYNPRCP